MAFVGNIAHHSDVGGKVAGSESADATSIFQEGLRIPPVYLARGGVVQQDVMEIVALNSRVPDDRKADLGAQLSALEVGRRRVIETVEKLGSAGFAFSMEALLEYSESRIRSAIADLPDGSYDHEDYLDHDGITESNVRLVVQMRVDGDDLVFDFAGTDPQIAGGRNMPLVATLSAVYYVIKAFLDPEIPANAGYFRAVRVEVPSGCMLNPVSPAPVSDRAATGNILGDLLFGVFAKAMPERAMAGCGPMQGLIFSGTDPRTGRYQVDYENLAGASGALAGLDGRDAVRVHVSGAANLPVEALEQQYPLVVERLELVPDSGGAGSYRGGLGMRRDVRLLADDAKVSGRGLRQSRAAPGVLGGHSGALGSFTLNPGSGDEVRLAASFSELPLEVGTVVRVETPGGGGYGEPLNRDSDSLAGDVQSGKISVQAAADTYVAAIPDATDDAG